MKNPEAVQINSRYGYITIVYFDENLTKIEEVVIYEMCTHDHPEGFGTFPSLFRWTSLMRSIQLQYSACVCMLIIVM